MKCRWVRRRIVRYDDGDLPPGEIAEIEAHLDTCHSCSAELAQLRGAVSLVESLAEVEPGAAFAADVLAAIRSGRAVEQPARPIAWPVGVALGAAGFLVSAVLIVGVLTIDWGSVGRAAVALAPSARVLLDVARPALVQSLQTLEPVARALTQPVLFALLADVLLLMAVLVVWRRLATARNSAGMGSMLA